MRCDVVVQGAALAFAFGASTVACRRPATDPPAFSPPESEEDPAKLNAHDAGVIPSPPCTADAVQWLVPVHDGATELVPPYEAATAFPVATGVWTAWIDHTTSSFMLRSPLGEIGHAALGPGDVQPSEIAAFGDDLIAVLPMQRPNGRIHRVLRMHGTIVTELFSQPETLDDEFDVAIVPTSQGAMVAWNDDAPNALSTVMGQFVPNAALHGDALPAPAAHALTPPDHDASDPVFVPRADGTAVMAWLSSHEVVDVISNATTADVFVRTISANGQTLGPAVQISPGPGNRFGVQAVATANAVWVVYRVAGDADQESQGDGGSIAVLRLGSDLHPTTSPAYVTARDANPSGPAAVLADGAGVSVFWTERDGDAVHTYRRAVEPDGRVIRSASLESTLLGEVPIGGDATRPWALLHGNHGEPGVIRLRCPPAPLPPATTQTVMRR